MKTSRLTAPRLTTSLLLCPLIAAPALAEWKGTIKAHGPAQAATASKPPVKASAFAAKPRPSPAAEAPPAAPTKTTLVLSHDQALYLVRSTLLALDAANTTGNYTVLRDLAAPGFRDRHTSADLSAIFAGLRQGGVDLAAAAVTAPRLARPATADPQGAVTLSGELDAAPRPVQFDLSFKPISGLWRLSALSIGLAAAKPAAVPPASRAPGT